MSTPYALRLNRSNLVNAALLWRLGCDTLHIAERLKVHEASVYNSLQDLRERELRLARESAARSSRAKVTA